MLISCLSCAGKPANQAERRSNMKPMKEIYLAGGCFWGTEHFLKQIEGVEATRVGYANGNIVNPTYQQVCTGTTNFAETVKVQYDPDKADLPFLIDLYFKTIDPTSLNRQGNDRGTQYRTGIYYTDVADLPVIRETVNRLAANYTRPLEVEIEPLKNFYPAEEYHQDYLDKQVMPIWDMSLQMVLPIKVDCVIVSTAPLYVLSLKTRCRQKDMVNI